MARHDVCEVSEALRCVSLRPDADVDSAASGVVALCARPAQDADQLLQVRGGSGFENTLVGSSEHLSREDCESEDYEFLNGRQFDRVYIRCAYVDETVLLSYQEFYEALCHYVEIRIKAENEEIQSDARQYLNAYKERYGLTSYSRQNGQPDSA